MNGQKMTRLRIVKGYQMLEVAIAPGEVVEFPATFEPWDPAADHRWTKKRAIGRGIWHVQWGHGFSTSFVDGLDAVEVGPRTW